MKTKKSFQIAGIFLSALCILAFACKSPTNNTSPSGKASILVEEITINSTDLILKTGTNASLTVFVSPADAGNKAVIWNSNSGAVTVNKDTGEITARAVGSAIVKAAAKDGSGIWSQGITVTVTDEDPAQVEEITINGGDDVTLTTGQTRKLGVNVLPAVAGNRNVTWESNEPEKVEVLNQTGEIKAIREGTATITAAAQDGSEVRGSIIVTVIPSEAITVAVSGVTIDGGNFSLTEGRSRTLLATVLPADATNKTLEWSSDNPAVAAVNSVTGVVTAKSPGTAGIIASALDGSEKSSSITVTVTAKPGESFGSVNLLDAEGWLESLYVTWEILDSADSYNVYYRGGSVSDWAKIDTSLIREYADYYRADILGLAAGDYQVKVLPVNEGTEYGTEAVRTAIDVLPHDRSGFAFSPVSPQKTASGAYNDNGTLKTGAQVLYLTAANAKTIEMAVKESASKTTVGIGIGNILALRGKGYDTTPLAIRIVGTITSADMSGQINSLSLLDFKGNKKGNVANITVEGVGNDATAYGWGIHVRSYYNLEVRNLGFMMFPDDGVSLEVDNQNIWVHNNDFFYGKDGGGDKSKGDGALDSKTSGYVTMSYNHFWDSGKCNLLGNGTEPAEYLTYHHNWYDHSDSRHPRVRFHSAHVYNNYYDGISKYGIGATRNSSIFAEANYFRNSKNPMLISMQGTDTKSGTDTASGSFSKEDGGMIKSYNNYMEGVSTTTYKPWSSSNTVEFDAYPVNSKSETVPDTVKTKQGGFTYNNFDTASAMYSYIADEPAAARDKVIRYAGRMGGKAKADFTWTFSAADDSSSDRSGALDAAIKAYKSKLISIQGGVSSGSGEPGDPGNPGEPAGPITGSVVCAFNASGGSNPVFSITGNTSNSKGTVTVNGTTYNYCLKMESSTNIAFSIDKPMTLRLVFGLSSDSAAGKNVKINGVNQKIGTDGILTMSITAGSHTITKGDTANLFYISLSE